MNLQVIIAITMGMFVTNLDATIVNIAFPSMARQFEVGTDLIALVELSYLVMICSLLPVFAKIGQRRGTAFVLRAGYVTFTVATLFCAAAPNLPLLIVARGLQGVGGAMLMAVGNALIVTHVPEHARGRAFGINTVLGAIGFAVGSPLGGLLTDQFGWRSVFVATIFPTVFGFALARRRLSDGPPLPSRSGFDFAGASGLFVGLSSLVLLFNQGMDRGAASAPALGLIVIGLIGFGAFVAAEKRAADPIITLGVFRHAGVALGLYGGLACVVVLDGMFFIMPFFFQEAQGYSVTDSGLLLGVFPLLAMVASPLAGWLVDRLNARLVSIGAGLIIIAGTLLFTFFSATTSLAVTLMAAAALSVGISMFLPANTALVMSHAGVATVTELSALYSLTQSLGSAVGVACLEMAYSLGFREGVASVPLMVEGFRRASWVSLVIALSLTIASIALKIVRKSGNPDPPITRSRS
ncbi:MAG: MFS transporter [Syntrophales bacterium]|jgi:EmrB/QacA subfamily drug resistance transporter|nr:MFS transporter [Syntrophales bacterium]